MSLNPNTINQPSGVMSSAVSLTYHTFTGQAYSSKLLTSIVHILSPENLLTILYGRHMTKSSATALVAQLDAHPTRDRRSLIRPPPGSDSFVEI